MSDAFKTSSPRRVSEESTKRRKRKRSSNEEVYEIERILDHTQANGKVDMYKVKWSGWSEEDCTWEPACNLADCLETIAEYFQNKIYFNFSSLPQCTSAKNALRASLTDFRMEDFNEALKSCITYDGDNIPSKSPDEIDTILDVLCRIPPSARDNQMLMNVKDHLFYNELNRLRSDQLKALKQWESEINTISRDPAPISVVNEFDLEGPPANFYYVNECVAGYEVVIPKDPVVGCECALCPAKDICCCHQVGKLAYKEGLVKVPPGTPIYECNQRCTCNSSCVNRVIQKGRSVPIAIYRTKNGCGWGLRTLKDIRKGEFVIEYVGEVITSKEAERRGRAYDKGGCTYLFDLDFNDNLTFPYTVDAAIYGNASHFINHSCSPNLQVFAVWVDCLDPDIPRLGLFACRDIKANEQLTFDYLCQASNKESKIKRGEHKNFSFQCKCNARNCRKFLF